MTHLMSRDVEPLSRPQHRFTLVDALRGVASLSVVIYHAAEGRHLTGLLALLPAWVAQVIKQGGLGVAVFFVLSGFVIAHSVARSRVTFSFVGRFMLRRSIRLDPPYWLAIVLAISFAYLAAHFVGGKEQPQVSLAQIAAHVFYLQEIFGYPGFNSVFWTLCQEVQFYLVFVLLLAVSHNDPAKPMQGRATALVFAGAALISLLWPLGILSDGPYRGSFLPLWHGFLAGAGAYWAWRNPSSAIYCVAYIAVLLVAGMLRGRRVHDRLRPHRTLIVGRCSSRPNVFGAGLALAPRVGRHLLLTLPDTQSDHGGHVPSRLSADRPHAWSGGDVVDHHDGRLHCIRIRHVVACGTPEHQPRAAYLAGTETVASRCRTTRSNSTGRGPELNRRPATVAATASTNASPLAKTLGFLR